MRYILLFATLFQIGCSPTDTRNDNQNTDNNKVKLTTVEINEVLDNWKKDSLGCLKLRRSPEKMNQIIEQLRLIGKDSATIINLLGDPNGRYGKRTERHFVWFTECGDKQTSYSNYYCHFRQDTVHSLRWVTF